MANDNIKDAGIKFGEGQPTDRGGRPKKIYTVLKDMGYSKGDVNTCFGELLWYTEIELLAVHSDTTKPIITQITAKALLESKKKGNMSQIKDILEQVIGKAKLSVELEDKTYRKDLSSLTDEELIEYQNEIKAIAKAVEEEY